MIPINYTIAKYWLTLPHYKQHVFVILLQIYVIFKNFVDAKNISGYPLNSDNNCKTKHYARFPQLLWKC